MVGIRESLELGALEAYEAATNLNVLDGQVGAHDAYLSVAT